MEDKLFEFDKHIVVIVLKKIIAQSSILFFAKIDLMFMSPQNNRIRYI